MTYKRTCLVSPRKMRKPNSVQQLAQALLKEWLNIPTNVITRYTNSMCEDDTTQLSQRAVAVPILYRAPYIW